MKILGIETLINNALMHIDKCRTRIVFQTYPAHINNLNKSKI